MSSGIDKEVMRKVFEEQECESTIKSAAREAYDELRWIVGDNAKMAEILLRLSHESFVEGVMCGIRKGGKA